MPPDTHIEILNADADRLPEPPKETLPDLEALSAAAADLGRRLVWLPETRTVRFFSDRNRALRQALSPVLSAFRGPLPKQPVGDDFRWLYDNLRLLHSDLGGLKEGFKLVRKLPHVRTPDGAVTPRVLALAAGFLAATGYEFSTAVAERLRAGFPAEDTAAIARTVGSGSRAEDGVAGRDCGAGIEGDRGSRRLVWGRRLHSQSARSQPDRMEGCS